MEFKNLVDTSLLLLLLSHFSRVQLCATHLYQTLKMG